MDLDLDKTIEAIVLELLQTYQRASLPSVKVLYVLDDSFVAESFSDQWIDLHNHGISYDILTLDGETSGWLGKHCIECTRTGGKCIAIDEFAPAPLELPKSYDAIIIPELDLDTASRVIHGMKGSVKAELIYAAILLNKYVLVAQDSTGIKRSDRRTLQTLTLPAAYGRRYKQTLDDLQELGVALSNTHLLAKQLIAYYKPDAPQAERVDDRQTTEHIEQEQDKERVEQKQPYRSKLLTSEWVRKFILEAGNRSLPVAKGTIITALAADLMKEKGVTLQVIE